MEPETMTATNMAVDYGVMTGELTGVVDGFATTATQPIQDFRIRDVINDHPTWFGMEQEPAVIATDRAWNPRQTYDLSQWYINARHTPNQWGGMFTIDPLGFHHEEAEGGLEDFDVPTGTDTALLECFGVA